MTGLRGLIFGNWPLKLAALGLATLLYAGVALSDSTRSWTGPVSIEVLRAPAGGALLESPGVVEEISYRAPEEVASELAAGSFRASIDLSTVEPRIGAEPVPVLVDVFPVDPRVRVVDYSPRSVNVRLDQVVTRDMPVSIDLGAIPEGIELGPVIVEPNHVAVSGASSRIGSIRSLEGRIPVDASGLNIDQDVTVEALDELGALVPGVQVDPARVRVTADVARQLAYATVPVLPELTGEAMHGLRVDDVTVEPATITVSGESPDVRQLEAIRTEPIDIGGQASALVVEAPLALPDEVTTTSEPTATVSVTFTDAEASRTYEVGTALVDTSAERAYRLADPSVSVVAAGPISLLDTLTPTDLIADVPVGGLEIGEHDVVPSIDLPIGLTVARLVPETVRVTVSQPS